MDLTVVVASIESARSIVACMNHLTRSCEGLAAEIIVVDASRDDSLERVRTLAGPWRLLSLEPGTVAPQLWAAGYRQARGRVVAFTTGHCLVAPGWSRALIEAVDEGATGAGGPLALAKDSGPVDWATYYLRYSGFMPETLGSGRSVVEIAGDNAAYARTSLDRHQATFKNGFWEVDFHHRLRAEGGWLAGVPAATVEFGRSSPFRTIFRHRFVHGRAFGASCVTNGVRTASRAVLAAPFVPFVLAIRSGRRALRAPASWRFVAALPWFLALAAAWAAGEAWGAVHDA